MNTTLKYSVMAVGAFILTSSPALASINTHESVMGAPAAVQSSNKLYNSISAKADIKSPATTDLALLTTTAKPKPKPQVRER